VSIFTHGTGQEHPMRGLEITNTSGVQLMPGPISVYDDGVYAGDAQVGHVAKGDTRLLAYAVDLDVTQVSKDVGSGEVRKVRIVKGLLEVQSKSVQGVSYTFANKDRSRGRTIVTEYPRMNGWELGAGAKPTAQTESVYRFETEVKAGGEATLAMSQERVNVESYQLAQFSVDTLMAYSRSGKASEAVVNAFGEAARRQGVIQGLQQQIASLEKEREEIDRDQARIRQNMGTGTIDRQSELYTRYVKKLGEQETRLEAITEAVAGARRDLVKAQGELGAYLEGLSVE
jgi:hypothetical protein